MMRGKAAFVREVAITGIGIVSCLGNNLSAVESALRAGKSGIVLDAERREKGFRSALTGAIQDFEPPRLPRKQRKTLGLLGLQAWSAAREAVEMAGWDDALLRTPRTGLIVGNDSAAWASAEQARITEAEKSTFPIGTGLIFQALTSTITMNLNVLLGTQGASWSLAGACASGGHAIGQAADLIALGRQDRILCGGAQEINWEGVASFDATNAFSLRQEDPPAASRPFDADRDGLVPSGGAALLCLEAMDLARERGATILGRVAGYAFSSDGHTLAMPDGKGLERCMRECLDRANVAPGAVDVVSAHATSTPVGDVAEAGAIARVFGDASFPQAPFVCATKSMTGHEMWMAGASQVLYGLVMARGGFVAPTRNFVRQESEAPPLRLSGEMVEVDFMTFLCNSAGFGGTNSCLLIQREDGTNAP